MTPPKYIDDARVLFWTFSGRESFGVVRFSDGEIAEKIHGLAIC